MELASDRGSKHDFQVPQNKTHTVKTHQNMQPINNYGTLLNRNRQQGAVNDVQNLCSDGDPKHSVGYEMEMGKNKDCAHTLGSVLM